MQLFNLINCRDVSATKMHGLTGLFRNKLTVFVIAIIVGVQVAACFTFLGVPVFEASKDIPGRHFAITVVAASSLLLGNAILKFIPQRWLAKVPTLDESKAIGGNSRLMSAYNTQANARAYPVKSQQAAPV